MIIGQGSRGPNPDKTALSAFGAQFAEVEVNAETGTVRVLRIVAVYWSSLTHGSEGISIPFSPNFTNMMFSGRLSYLYIVLGCLFSAWPGCDVGTQNIALPAGLAVSDIGVGFLWGFALHHYYLDQKIWHVRHDENVSRDLRLEERLSADEAELLLLAVLLGRLGEGYHLFGGFVQVVREELGANRNRFAYWFSRAHWRDFAQEQLLIGPLGLALFLPALVLAALAWRRKITVTSAFLALLGLTYLGASWVAGGANLGYARNWDLFSPGGLIFTAAAIGLFAARGAGRRLATPALLFAMNAALAAGIESRFGAEAGRITVVGPTVRVERKAAHTFVPRLVEAFPGAFKSVTLGAPSLEDVFIAKTGRRFREADAPNAGNGAA